MKTYTIILKFKAKSKSKKALVKDIEEFTKMLPIFTNEILDSATYTFKEEKGE